MRLLPNHPKSKSQNPESPRSLAAPRAIQLLPYQRRWVEDNARLKIVVKARQIGYSFAATLRAVFQCLERKTTWIFLSKGERQSRLLMEKVQEHVQTCGIVARASESTFFEGTSLKQLEVRFSNGSVIYGLPANPDTARGYSGNVTLDEFAFHADADRIYAALFPSITRGYALEVISTPNGTQGKFYELAKAAGLAEPGGGSREWAVGKVIPTSASLLPTPWSPHYCDIYTAVRQGLQIHLELLRAGCEDETAWQQEFCCQFVSTAENFLPPDLLAACLSAEASPNSPSLLLASAPGVVAGVGNRKSGVGTLNSVLPTPDSPLPTPEFFLGLDIGRRRDRTVFWVDEVQVLGARDWGLGLRPPSIQRPAPSPEGRVAVARIVHTMENTPFDEQLAFARELLSLRGADGQPLLRRACIDATGLGAMLAETLAREFAPRVEAVLFTPAVKEDLAYRTKRRLEQRLSLLPDTPEVRRAFSAVKRYVTPSGHVRLDAARTDAGHADEFWAKALADLAADDSRRRRASFAEAFLVETAPLVNPLAFREVAPNWTEWMM
jgi:phage FluMu gp28-like protein